jgi:hypothetical protein
MSFVDGSEVATTCYGRRVRPYALAVTYSTLVISYMLLVGRDGPGASLDGTYPGISVGAAGAIAAIALFVGFWIRSDQLMMVGLLLTSGAWFARGVFVLLDQGWVESTFLSMGWVVASVGAFCLEFLHRPSSETQ